MIPAIGTIIFAYVVARLIQIPIEYEGKSTAARGVIVVLSIVAILVASFSWLSLITAGNEMGKTAAGM